MFFRVSAMELPKKSVVLVEELAVPPTAGNSQNTSTSHGSIDLIAVAADKTTAGGISPVCFVVSCLIDFVGGLLLDPSINHLSRTGSSGFVVTQANLSDGTMWYHVPQAVGEMLACAKALG
jgi:hypothetical protein